MLTTKFIVGILIGFMSVVFLSSLIQLNRSMKDISNSLKILATPAEPYDSTSKCPYELGECPNAQIYWNDHKRDFQLEISNDTFYVYEDDRLVGLSSDTTEWHSPIGKIIEHEND